MILSSKQLEELEHLHDSVSEFDEEANPSSDSEDFDEASEGALAWRRGMIERAAAMVKKHDRKPLSSKEKYVVGSLVYDTINNRFARVKASSSSQVSLAYVSGGEGLLKGTAIQITQVPKPSVANTKKTAPKRPKLPKKSIAQKPIAKKKPVPKKPVPKKKPVAKKKPVSKKKIVALKKPMAKKKPAPKKKPVAQKKPIPKKKAIAKKPTKKIKKPTNINAFIKQKYKKLSNKELASITGLSEHTIRRKLGEWGLKRPIK